MRFTCSTILGAVLLLSSCADQSPSAPDVQHQQTAVVPEEKEEVKELGGGRYAVGNKEVLLRHAKGGLLVRTKQRGKTRVVAYHFANGVSFVTTLDKGTRRPQTLLLIKGKTYRFLGKHPKADKVPKRNANEIVDASSDGTVYTDCTSECEWFDYMTESEFINWYQTEEALLTEQAASFDTSWQAYGSEEETGCCDGERQNVNYNYGVLGVAVTALTDACYYGNLATNRGRLSCVIAVAGYAYAVISYGDAVEQYSECTKGCLGSGTQRMSYFNGSTFCEGNEVWTS